MNEQSDCCQPQATSGRACCPVNGKPYRQVDITTLMHHVRKPWQRRLGEQAYYFCTDPHCEVVYFGEDASTLMVDDLRTAVGQKSTSPERPVCYCFDITQAEIDAHIRQTRAYVAARTREGRCDCAIRNPSGQCCLKDFAK